MSRRPGDGVATGEPMPGQPSPGRASGRARDGGFRDPISPRVPGAVGAAWGLRGAPWLCPVLSCRVQLPYVAGVTGRLPPMHTPPSRASSPGFITSQSPGPEDTPNGAGARSVILLGLCRA